MACLHLHYFATSLVRQAHHLPADQPLVLVEEEQVYASCIHAEQRGIKPQMAERTARSLVPHALFYPAQPLQDAEVLSTVLNIIESHTDDLEPVPSPQQARVLLNLPVKQRADSIALVQSIGRLVRKQTTLPPL